MHILCYTRYYVSRDELIIYASQDFEIRTLCILRLFTSRRIQNLCVSRFLHSICFTRSRDVCIICVYLEMHILCTHLDLEMHVLCYLETIYLEMYIVCTHLEMHTYCVILKTRDACTIYIYPETIDLEMHDYVSQDVCIVYVS